jgi:hypothetical protein
MRDCLYTKIISALFGLGLLSCTYSANAQSSVATDSSALHIQNIKKGHIIFVLPSQLNKLTELYQIGHSDAHSQKGRERHLTMYKEVIKERDTLLREIQSAVDTLWDFCPYQFLYDFQLRTRPPDTLLAGLTPFPNEKLPGQGYRVRMGRTKATAHFGVEAMVVTDPDGRDLESPFPYYVKLNRRTWLNGLLSIFFPSSYEKKDASKLIRQLNENFRYFYAEKWNP